MGIYNPRQTIIVTCRGKEMDDAVTLSWHSPASFDPFMYAIFLATKRKSYELIEESGEFCVNFLTDEMEEMAVLCGTKSGRDIDKFKEGNIKTEECEKINCLRIKGCVAYMECRVEKTVLVGDHYMIVGAVLSEIENNKKPKLFQSNIKGPYTFGTVKSD